MLIFNGSDPECDTTEPTCDSFSPAKKTAPQPKSPKAEAKNPPKEKPRSAGLVRRPSLLKTVVSIKSEEPVTVVNYEVVENR